MTRAISRTATRCVFVAVVSFVAFVAWAPHAHAQPIQRASEAPAPVDKSRITFFLPLPYDLLKVPQAPVVGYFVWRITVETAQPFSIVVTSDTALRSNKAGELLRATSVRLCADPLVESAHECNAPVSAVMEVADDHFRITIRDADLVARVRRERPPLYWRYVIEPRGRYVLSQQRFSHQIFERP